MIEYVKPEVASACYQNYIKLLIEEIKCNADTRYFIYKDTNNEREKGFTEGMRFVADIISNNRPYFEKYFLEGVNNNEDK